MKRVAFLVVLGGVVAAIAQPSAMIPEQVRIDTGLLAGTVGTGQPSVRVFKGIPFAAPPLGENRWRAPQPAAKWEGVRKADAFGAPCAAGGAGGAAAGTRRRPWRRAGWRNRRTPARAACGAAPRRLRGSRRAARTVCMPTSGPAPTAPNERRPVMVWIYGGGFTGGSGGMAWYDGENLAAKGPVIVTFNYRLGSLWFLRASGSGEGIGPSRLRQLRDDGRDCHAAMGEAEHRAHSAAIRTTSPSPANRPARSWSARSSVRRRRRACSTARSRRAADGWA